MKALAIVALLSHVALADVAFAARSKNQKLSRPAFKCGPAENARAWQSLVDEFFAGHDLVPACP